VTETTIVGTDGSETLVGTEGADLIYGLGGNDRIFAGDGDDVVYGGSGVDVVDAGAGNDIIIGGDGIDAVDGGEGMDEVVFSGNIADYDISQLNGYWQVKHRNKTNTWDGIDRIVAAERLRFADATFYIAVNLGPNVLADAAAVTETGIGSESSPTVTGNLLTNDVDPDGDGLELTSVIGGGVGGVGLYGALTWSADGGYVYILDNTNSLVNGLRAGETLTETFTYLASEDEEHLAASGTLTVTVTGSNDAPTSWNVGATTGERDPVILAAFAASDPEDDGLTFELLGEVPVGVTLNAARTAWSFDPGTQYAYLGRGQSTTVVVGYRAFDGTAYSAPSSITVTVTGVNDAPTLLDVGVAFESAPGGTKLTLSLQAQDPDGPTMAGAVSWSDGTSTAQVLNSTTPGLYSGSAAQILAAGSYSVGISVTDGEAASATSSYSVQVAQTSVSAVTDVVLASTNPLYQGQGNGNSGTPVISADGTKVAFLSFASNLVDNDANGAVADLLLRDLTTGGVTLVSTNPFHQGQGTAPVDFVFGMSAAGTKLAFASRSDALVPGAATEGFSDIFVKDMVTGALSQVSNNPATGQPGNSNSVRPSMSGDGTRIAFRSNATNLTSDDWNGIRADVFVKDMASGSLAIVSTDPSFQDTTWQGHGNGDSGEAFISPDGGRVAFSSFATNFASGDGNAALDVFVKDLATGQLMLASASMAGTATGNGVSFAPALSVDGRKVVFASSASDLVENDTNGKIDIFVRDLDTGATTLVSTNPVYQGQGNGDAGNPSISADTTVRLTANEPSVGI